jgi:hypothetical protein
MSLAPRNEIGYNKVRMVLKNQILPLLLVPKPRVPQAEAAKVLAREVEAAMAPVVQRDATAARLTTIVFTRLQIVVRPPSFRVHGAGLLLQILNLHPHLPKWRYRLNLRLLMGRPPRSLLVKIAGQRSLRSGDGMSMGTPSAMLVVCLIFPSSSLQIYFLLTDNRSVLQASRLLSSYHHEKVHH